MATPPAAAPRQDEEVNLPSQGIHARSDVHSPQAENTPLPESPEEDDPNSPTLEALSSPSRNVNMHFQSFTANKRQFHIEVPITHKIIHDSYLTKLKNDSAKLARLKKQSKTQRFVNGTETLCLFLATALSAVPALALGAASYFIPLVVTAFLHQYQLLATVEEEENYSASFPSKTYLQQNVIMDTAVDNILWLSQELDNKHVFVFCDKGNKKGVDHQWPLAVGVGLHGFVADL
jgi:hypothetical protein